MRKQAVDGLFIDVARHHLRRAITLVEVLVTFTVLMVSIAIFAPVVLQVRDNTQASVCRSRMRHLADAVFMFENLKRGLPAGAYLNNVREQQGSICDDVGLDVQYGTVFANSSCYDIFGKNGGPNYGWIVNVLPFIDREDLHDDFDFSNAVQQQFPTDLTSVSVTGTYDRRRQKGIPVVARPIPSLLCPNDGGPKLNYNGMGATGPGFMDAGDRGGFAKTNYVGFASVSHIDHFKNREGALGGFELGTPVGQRIFRIADGQSNTLLLTEVRTLDRAEDSRGAWSLAFPGATSVAVDLHQTSGLGGFQKYVPDPNHRRSDVALPNSPTYVDIVVGFNLGSGSPIPSAPFSDGGAFLGAAPRSQHPGGVHAASLGGHVGLLSNDIDHFVYAYLVFTRDSQITDVDDYLDPSP